MSEGFSVRELRRALDADIFDPSERDRDADFAFGRERILKGIERLVAERIGGQREQVARGSTSRSD